MTWILDFTATTVSVIMFAILGVTGNIGEVEVSPYGYTVESSAFGLGIAVPPFAYHDPNSAWWVKPHEEGHLIQHQRMREWYWIAVGAGSVVGFHTGFYLWDSEEEPNDHVRRKR